MTSGWISSVSETSTISGFSIFLPRNSGVRPTMRPAMKTRDDAVDQRGKKPDAFPAKHALQHHADEGSHASERREAVVHRIHAAGREAAW